MSLLLSELGVAWEFFGIFLGRAGLGPGCHSGPAAPRDSLALGRPALGKSLRIPMQPLALIARMYHSCYTLRFSVHFMRQLHTFAHFFIL